MRGIKLLSILLAVVLLGMLGVGAYADASPAASEEIEDTVPAPADTAEPEAGEEPAPDDASDAEPAPDDAASGEPVPDEEPENTVYVTLYAGEYGYFDYLSVSEITYLQEKGSAFEPVTPTPINDCYVFAGWYTGYQGKGERITEGTILEEDEFKANACWLPNPDAIPVMELGTVYPLEVWAGGVIFSFTPDETMLYEISTDGNDPYEGIVRIRLMDDKLNTIEYSNSKDYDYNGVIFTELTAGTTYYIVFSDVFGGNTFFDAVIRRGETVPVTFHANPDNEGEAYFDGDPTKLEKTVEVRKGAHVESYKYSGLETSSDLVALVGWSLDPDATEDEDEDVIVTEPLDVYAIYHHLKSVILDTNGGTYPSWATAENQVVYKYTPGETFTPPYDPEIDDDNLEFAGWATTPDATEPDVFEGMVYDDLGDVLYAVYAEPVTVTYDANGGYMYTNPEMKTLQLVYGKGHIVYSTHVEHEDSRMELMGWVDQHGVVIPYTEQDYPYYQFMEDTYLTAIWGRRIVADANGACFRFDADLTALALVFPVDEPFSNNHIIELVGEPINFDDMKYLAGWATDPDATEPDVIEGETDVMDLTWIYAIWKDDSYYLAEGGDQTWEKGSAEGLTVTVKRTGDDTVTFSCFTGVKIDGEALDSFSRDEGSLILTVQPDYLETLAAGEHTLRIEFTAGAAVETGFTVTEADPSGEPDDPSGEPDDPSGEPDDPSGEPDDASGEPDDASGEPDQGKDQGKNDNKSSSQNKQGGSASPKTGDNAAISLWSAILVISVLGVGAAALSLANKKKNTTR